jgi:hypothetical protein
MSTDDRLKGLSRAQREALCREVLEQLSDYVEGIAPEDFCAKVEEQFAGCQPFDAYCNTLAATIELARDCSDPPVDLDDAYRRSVEVVRQRLDDIRNERR